MSELAEIQKTAQAGNFPKAEEMLALFLRDLFPLDIKTVDIRRDALSLNSVNGFVNLNDGGKLFFKFHHEEKEEALTEYYNSQLLSDNGYPVEMPAFVSKEVGKQVLLYPVITSERLADTCKKIEQGDNTEFAGVVAAQDELDEIDAELYIKTLHRAKPAQLADEPILQLFYNRLLKGGRKEQFYDGKECEFPGLKINFDELQKLKWRINGVEYNCTLQQAFADSFTILAPEAHGEYTALVAHGDAHNGNVWYNKGKGLSLFDPAFAGKHIPALLAEIKATFHNIFAHPLWLYDSQEADKNLTVTCKINGGFIEVQHNWQLSDLRTEFLKSKQTKLWKPLLAELQKRGELPENWEKYMRLALFCCPTLVMNLRANAGNSRNFHTLKTSALGFAISIMLSSAPTAGKDVISEFFDKIRP